MGANLDLDDLARLAREATAGPWFFNGYNNVVSKPVLDAYDAAEALIPSDAPDDDPRWGALPEPDVARVSTSHGDTASQQGAANARYIAAAHPAAVLALIERVRVAERDRDAAVARAERAEADYSTMRREIAESIALFVQRSSGKGGAMSAIEILAHDRDEWKRRALDAELACDKWRAKWERLEIDRATCCMEHEDMAAAALRIGGATCDALRAERDALREALQIIDDDAPLYDPDVDRPRCGYCWELPDSHDGDCPVSIARAALTARGPR